MASNVGGGGCVPVTASEGGFPCFSCGNLAGQCKRGLASLADLLTGGVRIDVMAGG